MADAAGVSLHFRSFGRDHGPVAREFNAFASGEHPAHLGFRCDGTDGGPDRRIKLEGRGYGSFFRDDEGPVLALGAEITSAGSRSEALDLARAQSATVAAGVREIHELLRARSASGHSLCLRDHWAHWRDRGEAASAGKLLTVGGGVSAILVDDNVRGPDGHIADVREGTTGVQLPWGEAAARGFVVKACPYAAVTEPRYFTELIAGAVARSVRGDA